MGQGLSELLLSSSPFCPSVLSCLAHWSARSLSVWVFLQFIIHVAFPSRFRAGLSLLVAVTVWTSSCWSLLAFAEDISQWVNQCCAVEAKSNEIWQKGYGRVCRSVPSIFLPLEIWKTCWARCGCPTPPCLQMLSPCPLCLAGASGCSFYPHTQSYSGSGGQKQFYFPSQIFLLIHFQRLEWL